MIDREILAGFLSQFENLKAVVIESRKRAIDDPPDILFASNQNVFIKSYLVSACSMLEAFIQDLATAYVNHLQLKINSANLPFNLVMWIANVDKENDKKLKQQFKMFEAKKNREDISDLISPNYWKTMNAFTRVGIDLSSSEIVNYKDKMVTTVNKRNRIVHHNDDALDISFSDIVETIDEFKSYSECLFEAVCADRHLRN